MTSDREVYTEYSWDRIDRVVNSPCNDGGQVELEKISYRVLWVECVPPKYMLKF